MTVKMNGGLKMAIIKKIVYAKIEVYHSATKR